MKFGNIKNTTVIFCTCTAAVDPKQLIRKNMLQTNRKLFLLYLIFAASLAILGSKQQVTGGKLKGYASKRPHVSGIRVPRTNDNLGSSVLPCLYFTNKLLIGPAGIPEIDNLTLQADPIQAPLFL